ncbi:MAG: hypothetical protein L0K86_15780, partial [Actinomycetia bacterium]|nr:hypothetical protein [Actinomycetes bacterium]
MQVSVSRDHAGDPGELTVVAAEPRSRLVHRANVGAGVLLEVDVLAPCRWLSLSVDAVDNLSGPIVEAMVGAGGADSFRAGRGRTALDVDLTAAVPWLRVAQVDAFDRWLHLPLDQAIVDAERGVSRLRAARTLPAGSPARQAVLGDALRIARRASAGVVAHLRQLADTRISVPVRLRSAIDQLVDGYAGLATVVAGSDRELAAVPAAWRTLRDRVHPVDADRWCRSQTPGLADRPVAAAAVSLLDPR